MTTLLQSLDLNWTTIVSGAINAVIIGFATATGIVFANRYTVRVLDRLERNGKVKKNEGTDKERK